MQGNDLKIYFLSQFKFLPQKNRKTRLKGVILKEITENQTRTAIEVLLDPQNKVSKCIQGNIALTYDKNWIFKISRLLHMVLEQMFLLCFENPFTIGFRCQTVP